MLVKTKLISIYCLCICFKLLSVDNFKLCYYYCLKSFLFPKYNDVASSLLDVNLLLFVLMFDMHERMTL